MKTFERMESGVRLYCRAFPVVFSRAEGAFLYDAEGRRYIDFFSGAGALSYGHNDPGMKKALIEYLESNGVVHGLDMATTAKKRFLERFESVILEPRRLDYKVQFTGPTGTNAVEAALKLARLVKKRSNVIAFTNGFHGLTAGALSVTSNRSFRNEFFVNRLDVCFMPFDGYLGEGIDTLEYIRRLLSDPSSGIDPPAAAVVETVQAEGGVNVASAEWLRGLEALCREFDILLIVDDIQVGCGRTGTFFSFEDAGIRPDMLVLSKAISGFGLPMSLLLIKPELDQWAPGEHTGTFRGNSLAFVTAVEALRYWEDGTFPDVIARKGRAVEHALREIAGRHPALEAEVRGRGLIYGLRAARPGFSKAVAEEAFTRGLILERCGPQGRVLKFLPPLIIGDEVLKEGMALFAASVDAVIRGEPLQLPPFDGNTDAQSGRSAAR
ncbi:diaminobutyrate--2-oxoglutarate transaminase [Planctomycetota bacterium]